LMFLVCLLGDPSIAPTNSSPFLPSTPIASGNRIGPDTLSSPLGSSHGVGLQSYLSYLFPQLRKRPWRLVEMRL
jgi:hypothetical protein